MRELRRGATGVVVAASYDHHPWRRHTGSENQPERDRRYVDFEDEATTVVSRLLALGLDAGAITERFHYVRPDEPLTDANRGDVGQWAPAIEASGVRTPARIYDLRSTFASNALAVGVSVFQLARIMGTSVRMIERHYGAMLDGSSAEIATQLDALDADRGDRAEDG